VVWEAGECVRAVLTFLATRYGVLKTSLASVALMTVGPPTNAQPIRIQYEVGSP
jgi:hypothetical protein